jgi:ubiquinone/menaquinone biosynthesis C-methylase UbiE
MTGPNRQRRDVEAFEERARRYDQGWQGRMHHEIADRTVAVAAALPAPRRVLDVGCGTGYLLGLLAARYPDAIELAGIDPAPTMVEVATASSGDGRLRFSAGVAENLPYSDQCFDLVVSTTSFDHWSDQSAGLRECRRVIADGGHLVLVDQFSLWLLPTMMASRRGKARTRGRANALLVQAGFRSVVWHRLYAVLINAVIAKT